MLWKLFAPFDFWSMKYQKIVIKKDILICTSDVILCKHSFLPLAYLDLCFWHYIYFVFALFVLQSVVKQSSVLSHRSI